MNVNYRCPKSPSAKKGRPKNAIKRSQIQVDQILHSEYKLYLEREEEKLVMAKILSSEEDFNYVLYRKYMFYFFRLFELNYDRYDLVCTAVSVHIFRVLERFLSYQCQLDLEYLPHNKLKPLVKIIVKGKYELETKDFETVINVARYAYELDNNELQQEACLSLYETIIRHSAKLTEAQKQRLISKVRRGPVKVQIEDEIELIDDQTEKCTEHSPTYYINKIWSEEHDYKLISFFKENQNFIYVAKRFRDTYPDLSKFFVPEGLKNRMRRIIRGAIRKLRQQVLLKHKAELPKLAPIHDTTTCFPLQLLLLNILDDTYTVAEVKELINGINLLTEDHSQRQNQKSLRSQNMKKSDQTEDGTQ